jgi:type I restriction enzyme S subunit
MKRWPTKPLGDVCAINPKLAASERPAAGAEVTFVPMAAVDEVSGTIVRPERRRYSEVAKGYTPFREKDVLFAKITPCMQNGKAAIARNLCAGLGFGSTEFHVLRPCSDLLPQWVFAFIRQPPFRSAAEASFTGSAGQQRVPADFLKKFPIPVPPLAEQERIVELLDEADEFRKLRAKAYRRTATLIPALFREMFGDPVKNPNGWPKSCLGECCELINGAAFKATDWNGVGLPIIRIQNLNEPTKAFNYTSKHLPEKFRVRPGDILLSWSGTPGTSFGCFRWDGPEGWLNQHIFNVKLATDLDGEFFIHSVNARLNELIAKAHGGVGLQHVTKGVLDSVELLIPPLLMQKQFADRVNEIRRLEAGQAASRLRLEALFQSLLHRAFNGEL